MDRNVIAAFQSSIAPHHTTHQMTTKETLLDMRRKFFILVHPCTDPVKHLLDILILTGTIVSSARSFAMVGFMIVGIECIIETHRCCLDPSCSLKRWFNRYAIFRAKTDVWNAVYGGGVTGGKMESQN